MQTSQKLSVIPFDTAKLRMSNKLNILDTFELIPFNIINSFDFIRLNRNETLVSVIFNSKELVSIKSSLRNFKDTIYEYILKINLSCVDIPLKQELVLISRRIRGEHL